MERSLCLSYPVCGISSVVWSCKIYLRVHFNLIFTCGVRERPTSTQLHTMSSFLKVVSWRDTVPSSCVLGKFVKDQLTLNSPIFSLALLSRGFEVCFFVCCFVFEVCFFCCFPVTCFAHYSFVAFLGNQVPSETSFRIWTVPDTLSLSMNFRIAFLFLHSKFNLWLYKDCISL